MNVNITDAGRSKSRRPKQSKDCVVRAFAIALDWSYDDMYDAMAQAGRKCSRSTPKRVWQTWISTRALRIGFNAHKGAPRMTLERFAQTHNSGVYVVQCAKHVMACVNGVMQDTAIPRRAACVYACWKVR